MQKWEYIAVGTSSSVITAAGEIWVHDIHDVVDLKPFISETGVKVKDTSTGTRLHNFKDAGRAQFLILNYLGQMGWEAFDAQGSGSGALIYLKRPIDD